LGGHYGGTLAARRCVEAIVAAFTRVPDLSDAGLQALVKEADRAVAALRLERGGSSSSMRTTLALLAVCGDNARWAHVGDSRVYWFRHRILMQRTRDHSVSEFVMGLPGGAPAAPRGHVDRHRLLRGVGAGEGCRAELGSTVVTLQAGDAFLLCSDGFWSLVSDPEIIDCLSDAPTPLDWCVALEQRLKKHIGVSLVKSRTTIPCPTSQKEWRHEICPHHGPNFRHGLPSIIHGGSGSAGFVLHHEAQYGCLIEGAADRHRRFSQPSSEPPTIGGTAHVMKFKLYPVDRSAPEIGNSRTAI
jgi:serine/threonine protein phosphatase PrpC